MDARAKQKFEKLFEELADSVYRLCVYKTSDPAVAEDLTQEIFTRVWKYISRGNVLQNEKAFVYKTANNLIIDHYKKHKSLSLDVLQENGFDPEAYATRTDSLAEMNVLTKMFSKLDPEYQEPLYLRLVEEWAVKDIAETLGISENLVSVRINRGKKKLQELYEKP